MSSDGSDSEIEMDCTPPYLKYQKPYWQWKTCFQRSQKVPTRTRIMPRLVFDTCCGCIELRTGCLIIGYINLVLEIIGFVVGLIGLLAGERMATAPPADSPHTTSHILGNIAVDMMSGLLVVGAIIVLIIVFVLFAFTVVLLVGLHQNKRGYLLAYLIYSYVFLVIAVFLLFVMFGGPVVVKEILWHLAIILTQAYITLVVRSYYHKMDEKMPLIYNTQDEFVGKLGHEP